MINLSKEDEYIYDNCIKLFILISAIFIILTISMINPEIYLRLLETRKNMKDEDILRTFNTCKDVNLAEALSLSAIQFLITINMIKSYLNNNVKQIILTIKYFALFMTIHMLYFLLSAFIL